MEHLRPAGPGRAATPGAAPGSRSSRCCESYARAITRHAVLVLVVTALVTAAAIAQLVDFRTGTLRLQIDTSIEQMLPSGDENRAYYDRMRKLFGNDETLLLVVHRPEGIFTTEVLGGIARLSKRVQDVDGVSSVLSLSTAPNISSHDGELVIAPLFETPPTDAAEPRAREAGGLRQSALRRGHGRAGRQDHEPGDPADRHPGVGVHPPRAERLRAALAARPARPRRAADRGAGDRQADPRAGPRGVRRRRPDLAGRQRAHQGRDLALT